MKVTSMVGSFAVVAMVLGMVLIWRSAVHAAGAENDAPALSTTIVISQAYGGGGGANGTYIFDYVELKNISNAPRSLNGLSLMYGSATGQFGSSGVNIFALPNVTLNPGQFYLVQLGPDGTGGSAFPVTPDAVTGNLSMSGTNGKIALTASAFAGNSCGASATPCILPNAGIVDLVAWGTSNNAEGGSATNGGSALIPTQGNVRKGVGCTETDNNNGDLDVVSAPVPRNTATTVSPCGAAVRDVAVDVNGDGHTDHAVVRAAGGAGAQLTWHSSVNGGSPRAPREWGVSGDQILSGDFDGDGADDEAVFRASTGTFYIIHSATLTIRTDQFGQPGDDARVVADYDGDNRDDLALYRSGSQSLWFYKISPTVLFTAVAWGQMGDVPAPGDYDGDGKADFVVRRADGPTGVFWKKFATGATETEAFGLAADSIVPGDYDGDGKTDLAVMRTSNGFFVWDFEPSGTAGASVVSDTWGIPGDITAQGDYDGDGKTDYAVWRPVSPGTFYVMTVGVRTIFSKDWGQPGDIPVAHYNTF